MFDVGFSELGVIGLVALIVIGPEQLPRVARTAGHLMGRLRRYVSDVKSDISREMELADLQRLSDEVRDSARSIESSIREQVAGIESEVQQSIAMSEVHHIEEAPVAQANNGPEQAALPLDPSPAQIAPVDPNQIDMFGNLPAEPSESPEKH
jgi:sec-independent protein translocase protein TatB